jgi:hypothetical protein
MSILIVPPEKELKIRSDSFQTNRPKIVHRTKEIVIVSFRIKGTPIIVDQISRDKLLQPNKRYALIGNCLEEGKEETWKSWKSWKSWRPCGVFRLPEELPLQRVKDYIRDTIKVAIRYPGNTYYLRNKDIAQLGLIQMIMENDPEEKEIELSIGETALQLCLSKNAEIKLDINDEENREQVARLIDEMDYLDCKHLQEFIPSLAKEIIEQIRKNYARKVTNFFKRHLDKVDWILLSKNPNIPVEFFEKYWEKISWKKLSGNLNIPVEFFERHLDSVDWIGLSGNPNIPVDFFERHLENVNWYCLSRNPNIPAEFFERHLENVEWTWLSMNQNIPAEFFERHLENVEWTWLSMNPNIPAEFFERHLEDVNWTWLPANPNIPAEFFERHLEEVDWFWLSGNPNIPVEFFERHLESVNWESLSHNPNIPVEFFERHLESVDWESLSRNPNIPVEFFERHLESVNWFWLSKNPNIPVEFFERHLEGTKWNTLLENPRISKGLSGNRFLYDNYALMNAIKKSNLFPEFSNLWKKEAIKIISWKF